jgi:hypothetical protein
MLRCVARRGLRNKNARLAKPLRRGIFGAGAMATVMAIGIAIAGMAGPAQAQVPASPAGNPAKCLPFPGNLQLNPHFPLPKPPPGSRVFHAPEPACGYLAGSVNLRKLAVTVPVGPGLSDLRLGLTTYAKFKGSQAYVQQDLAGQFQYHGLPELPPKRVTFQAFGHLPVSATIHVAEIGSFNMAVITCAPAATCPYQPANTALFLGRVTLRISNVDIDGAPVSVGPHCQTATPFDLSLTGLPPAYNINAIQGVLTGTVAIPAFKGCGSKGHNLDPFFTASVSGPGNSIQVTQARLCTPVTGSGCPPARPNAG